MEIEVDEETAEGIVFICKYILLPICIIYLFAVEILIVWKLYRQALTLVFLIFTLNAMIWNRKVLRR